jgi:single-stranded-DNA-specific exonuclease
LIGHELASGDFLGVSRSLSGRRWRERYADPNVTRAVQAKFSLSEPLARALVARGAAEGGVEAFLRPTLRELFPNPSSFADMDLAAVTLVEALEADRNIVVFADYDVDGATSAAQLVRWFRHMGKALTIYVPDRVAEGYGPSPAAFERLKAAGAEVVITVDCGAAAYDALAAADDLGLTVVVVDHHLMRGRPPGPIALVNPNRADCDSGQGMLAAAGVTFVLLAALNRECRARGLFASRGEPDLRQWLDLVALGAICDVTQLVGFNRALVAQGLRVMSVWSNPGMRALMAVAGAGLDPPGVFEAGFILGPRINAGGRIGRADLGARLLSTDDPEEAADLARRLDTLNAQRKDVEKSIVESAAEAIDRDSNLDPSAPAIVVAREDWHPGVVGIVASRLREIYRKPVVVIGVDRAADMGRGSGRSQPGVNLGRAVQAAYDEGLLLSGGGHAMAAGLTLRPSAAPEFRDFLCSYLSEEVVGAAALDVVEVDALIAPGEAARAILEAFRVLAPHGPGNPEPAFALANVRAENAMPLRGGHVRCSLVGGTGAKLGAVAWRAADSAVGRRLLAGGGSIHVVGKLKTDTWNGRQKTEIEIEDIADPRQM